MNQYPAVVAVADKDEQLVVGHGGKEDAAGKAVAYTLHMAVAGTAGAADNDHVEAFCYQHCLETK